MEETDAKAKTFEITLARHKLVQSLQEKMDERGWKVKRKEWEWVIPAGKLGYYYGLSHTLIIKPRA